MFVTPTTRPISEISAVAVYVSDQDGALSFYTQVLGFELVRDELRGEQRWIEVALPGRAPSLALVPEESAREDMPLDTNVVISTDDIGSACEELRRRGVDVRAGIRRDWGPPMVVFEDPDGNRFLLVER